MRIPPCFSIAAVCGACAAVATIGAEPPPVQSGLPPLAIEVGPVLQSPTTTGVTVTWLTNRATTAAVEFGPDGGALQPVVSSHHGLIDGNSRLHQVALRDLLPGTVYRYRIVSREIVDFRHWKVEHGSTVTSEFQQFRLPGAAQSGFSFVVFNDIHGATATIPELLKVAGTPAAELVVFNGDIVSFVDEESQITGLLQQFATEFGGRVPLLWVRGNHETRGKLARRLPEFLDLPEGRYY